MGLAVFCEHGAYFWLAAAMPIEILCPTVTESMQHHSKFQLGAEVSVGVSSNANGAVTDVELTHAAGEPFDSAAKAAAWQWRFARTRPRETGYADLRFLFNARDRDEVIYRLPYDVEISFIRLPPGGSTASTSLPAR